MKKKESLISKIFSWITFIILLIAIIKLFGVFRENYFNGFIKGEVTQGISSFKVDFNEKYLGKRSYKIESNIQNSAAFYKEVEVTPNTVYKVTCKVKTQDVIPGSINTDGGAQICLIEAPEISKSITGTTNWQEIEMLFNSGSRTSVKIGFRLGGNSGTAKGTAWFSDFKLEKGVTNKSNTWNIGCFIFKNLDVNIDGQEEKYLLSTSDIQGIRSNVQRFKSACETLSEGKMKVKYTIHEINDPITTVSYSEEHGHYVDPYDVNKLIEDIVIENEYDYIFTVMRMGNEKHEIFVNDWIGLR